ncbi:MULTISPECIES: hypothetical protein [unclassified Staphylococcus]|uniref:hypothetical protein n=1 Tax=unclassified Staphylococcus TaxID=91994 RepID=UPI0021D19163|nr:MULTISPECIES: hypothetical protein [unclassified Staphylococcus]UXR78455.1 hypothetical protein MUA92_00655 [Staphylococcus sp. IVB6227]UXR82613.1 hypothetical protein MUA51_00625 [Staphylococcus sp. IVB6214]
MKKQNMFIGVVASTMLLAGCGFLNNNSEKPSQSETQTTSQKDKEKTQQDQNKKNETQNNSETEKNNTTKNNEAQQSKGSSTDHVYQKNTREYYAQIWLSVRNDIDSFDDLSLSYGVYDRSGESVNYNNADASATFPQGTMQLMPTPTAGGSITFKDNGDGTITVYDVPTKFQDLQWIEDDNYSLSETQKMINSGQTYPIKNVSQSDIDFVAEHIENSTPISSGTKSSSNASSSSSSSSTTVTRNNVIDLVEDYEGHMLDTDTYTYKEPEQMSDGRWGFSILDKAGNLKGSYIIDTDGTVTKYDEKGQPV